MRRWGWMAPWNRCCILLESQDARFIQSGGECALSPIGSKHKNCVAAARTPNDLGRDEEIAEPIKGQTGRTLIRIERGGPGENGARSARCEHIDRLVAEVRCVEISPAIKGQAIALPGQVAKRALGPIRRELIDYAGFVRIRLVIHDQEDFVRVVDLQVLQKEAGTGAADISESRLRAIGSDFQYCS